MQLRGGQVRGKSGMGGMAGIKLGRLEGRKEEGLEEQVEDKSQ